MCAGWEGYSLLLCVQGGRGIVATVCRYSLLLCAGWEGYSLLLCVQGGRGIVCYCVQGGRGIVCYCVKISMITVSYSSSIPISFLDWMDLTDSWLVN